LRIRRDAKLCGFPGTERQVKLVDGGRVDEPETWHAPHDKSDVHGEVCSAADKLARTVERVDQEKSIIEGWTFPPAHCLLSHDGNARRATSKGFQNNLFCLAIGSRD